MEIIEVKVGKCVLLRNHWCIRLKLWFFRTLNYMPYSSMFLYYAYFMTNSKRLTNE